MSEALHNVTRQLNQNAEPQEATRFGWADPSPFGPDEYQINAVIIDDRNPTQAVQLVQLAGAQNRPLTADELGKITFWETEINLSDITYSNPVHPTEGYLAANGPNMILTVPGLTTSMYITIDMPPGLITTPAGLSNGSRGATFFN